jgi:hypothetical protein
MKKSEAEASIRNLCHLWRETRGLPLPDGTFHYSFLDFKVWLDQKGYRHYLRFRPLAGAEHAAEMWFDQEMKQTRRN